MATFAERLKSLRREKSWSQQRGFVLACSSSRRLSDREEVVEQCYGRHRDEGWTYAL